ncbi:hypothetical protein [Streptomyces sp. NPDC020983]|uniref:hypothetical protein n=1 Tax=Streptomyces sp. NPDC020983 TaxID=3365106 RepID=UPI0037A68824
MRTSASAALVAAAALIAAGTLTGTASAAPLTADAGNGPLTAQPVPPGSGSLFDVTQAGAHVTFASGLNQRAVSEKVVRQSPLLLRKDDRDGKGWQAVALPSEGVGNGDNEINSTAAVPGTAGEAWAVGLEGRSTANCGFPPDFQVCGPILADHFDGTSWQAEPVPTPANAEGGGLVQVAASGPSDVWATGWLQIFDSGEPNPAKPGGWIIQDHMEALVVHWDGHAWKRFPVPDALTYLPTSLVVSGHDVYTAGWGGDDVPVVQHWNGSTWTAEKLPDSYGGEVYGLGVDGTGSVWAVGRTLLTEDDPGHALLLRRTGGVWREVPAPADAGQLTGIAFTPSGVAVAGSVVGGRDGYVAQSDATGWHRLALPAAPEGGLVATESVSYSPRQGVTVVGHQEGPDGPFAGDAVPVVLAQR